MPSILIASWAFVWLVFGPGARSQSFIHDVFLSSPPLGHYSRYYSSSFQLVLFLMISWQAPLKVNLLLVLLFVLAGADLLFPNPELNLFLMHVWEFPLKLVSGACQGNFNAIVSSFIGLTAHSIPAACCSNSTESSGLRRVNSFQGCTVSFMVPLYLP